MREITYRIEKSQGGQKISGFLKTKGYSEQNLVNLKKDAKSVQVNGVYVHQNYVLVHKDRLTVQIREQETSEQIIPTELPVEIVYEDEDLMVVNKSAGMPIHPSRNNFDNSLGNALAWHYERRGEPFVFRCINRLDRDTSGLTIVAKHMVSAAILGRMVAEKSRGDAQLTNERLKGIVREYLAVIEGVPCPYTGVISAPIARIESLCLERAVDFEKGDCAVTHYEVLEEYGNRSLVRLILETGRTHQIRVHMKYIGHPLLGDFLYHPAYAGNQIDRVDVTEPARGSKCRTDAPAEEKAASREIGRQALHAYRLNFVHPMTREPLEFTAPMPDDMMRLLQTERA